ncbi:MAG: pentapeptide repeat-containing protein [Caulobacter sp.]|nr:pentapeptide repeat-containing protein [Caulobacter sp.]
MKRLIALSLGIAVLAGPALAQNAGQIARVRGGASCPGCNLFQADLTGLERRGLNLSRSRLRQATLTAAVMNRTNFSGADLRDADASAAVFGGASFAGADLSNANFVGSYLQGANFRGAKLNGTVFSGVEMDRAVGLTQAQLNHACGDLSTRLPAGLRIPQC